MKDNELIQSFLSESADMLDDIEPKIIEVQHIAEGTGVVNQDTINAIFRLFHSIKGSAGFLQMTSITAVTHEAETLLDLFRKGKASIQASHSQLLCRTCDHIRALLCRIEESGSDTGLESETKTMAKAISAIIAAEKGKTSEAGSTPAAPPPAPVTAPPPPPPEPTRNAVAPAKSAVSQEMMQIFIAEAWDIIEQAEQALLGIEQAGDNPAEMIASAMRAFHTLKGNSGLIGVTDLEKLSHKVEEVLQCARNKTIALNAGAIKMLLRILDAFRRAVEDLSHGGSGEIMSLHGILDLLGELLPATAAPPPSAQLVQPPPPNEPPAPQPPTPEAPPALTPAPAPERKEPGMDDPAGLKSDLPAASLTRRDIRVNIEKLDLLTNLVGELVIAEAMVANNADLQGLRLDNFERCAHQLNRITSNLQDIAMSLRMVPIESTFRKMIRLVHDLAAKAGKKVDLKLVGEDTEVDRTVAELISDPLVHMVRNSVDHGIEPPDQRRQAGKPETGSLVIEARYQAGEVWIIIRDDGRGLNREKILAKAADRGLVQPGAGMRDEEIYNLIFLPGFSTADKVTDVSGRGVGMDVVKKNIEKIRGRIDIQTTPGRGCVFTIRIPLTLAIIQGMLVRIAHERYIIPLLSIRESFRADKETLSTVIGQGELISIRGELIPLFRLYRLFDTVGAIEDSSRGIIVVVEHGSSRVGILVDELLGQQQTVIKNLGDKFGDVKGVSGASIMSDGRIGLILDVEGIIKLTHEI